MRAKRHMIHLPELSIGLGAAVTIIQCSRNIRTIAKAVSNGVVCVIDETGRMICEFYRIAKKIIHAQRDFRTTARMRIKGRRLTTPQQRKAPLDNGRRGRKRSKEKRD